MRLFLRAGIVLSLAVAAACGKDAVAPKSPADPQATASELATIGTVFTAAPLKSLSWVAGAIAPSAPAPLSALALAGSTNPLTRSSRLRSYAQRIDGARVFSRLLPAMSVSGAAALFPAEVVGKTFEWNFTTLQYEPTARTGAPATGVRFILYAIDELNGRPAGPSPGVEVGYIDLNDETGSGNPKVHVTVAGVGGTPVYVDYTVTLASQSATSVRITTGGYITNGAASPDSLRFSGTVTVSSSTSSISVTEDVSFDVNSHGIHVRNWQRVTITETTLSLQISFRFEYGGEVVTLDGTLDIDDATGNVSGTFTSRVDGGLYATCTVTGTSNSFTLACTAADEDGLSADDDAALDALSEAAGNVSTIFEGLLTPAIGVLGGA